MSKSRISLFTSMLTITLTLTKWSYFFSNGQFRVFDVFTNHDFFQFGYFFRIFIQGDSYVFPKDRLLSCKAHNKAYRHGYSCEPVSTDLDGQPDDRSFPEIEIQEFMFFLTFAVLKQWQHAYAIHLFLFSFRADDFFECRQYIPERTHKVCFCSRLDMSRP